MAPHNDDSSDSESETSEVVTSVLLGVPDGPVDTISDLLDAAVSRIGGLPVRLYPTLVLHTTYPFSLEQGLSSLM